MADLAALLAAIYAQPDDDAARVVYADALQELGDPRGEFIALQLEGVTTRRVREMSRKHGEAWLGALSPIVLRCTWERGFPAAVVIDIAKLPAIKRVAKDPAWSTIRTVQLGGSVRFGENIKAQRQVHRALARAPGFAGRTISPSLAEIEATLGASKVWRRTGGLERRRA